MIVLWLLRYKRKKEKRKRKENRENNTKVDVMESTMRERQANLR